MSRVEEIIHEQLRGQGLEKLPNGYRHSLPQGTTDLTFEPATHPAGDFGLCAIATIETRFIKGMPAFLPRDIARLNRRAVFGNFLMDDGSIGAKLTFSVYEKEPAYTWVARILLTALGAQLACGIGFAQSELSDELLRANRANLEYPRKWVQPPEAAAFDAAAERFRQAGLVATRGPHGLVLEVPLAPGAPSRMIDGCAETALLHVSVDVPHPLAGVGYTATIALPFDPPASEIADWSTYLNEREHERQDFVPRLGAWGIRGARNQLVYSMFWPTTHADSTMHSTMMNWMVRRVLWLKSNFWVAGQGLDHGTAAS
jgi:hypothetical protein